MTHAHEQVLCEVGYLKGYKGKLCKKSIHACLNGAINPIEPHCLCSELVAHVIVCKIISHEYIKPTTLVTPVTSSVSVVSFRQALRAIVRRHA